VRRIQTASEVGVHFRLNLEFHEVLVNLSGNLRLAEIYRQLKAHIQMALIHFRSEHWTGRVPYETEEHLAILAAIEANDRDALKIAIDVHLTRARTSLLGQAWNGGGKMKIASVEAIPVHARMAEGDVYWGNQPWGYNKPKSKTAGLSVDDDRTTYPPHWRSRAAYSQTVDTTIVKITTDDAIVGWGEAKAPVAPEVTATIIRELMV
jgi:hypothetical protein